MAGKQTDRPPLRALPFTTGGVEVTLVCVGCLRDSMLRWPATPQDTLMIVSPQHTLHCCHVWQCLTEMMKIENKRNVIVCLLDTVTMVCSIYEVRARCGRLQSTQRCGTVAHRELLSCQRWTQTGCVGNWYCWRRRLDAGRWTTLLVVTLIIVGRGQWPVALGVLTVTVVAGVQAGCPADVAPSGWLPRGFLQDLLWCVLPGAVLQWRGVQARYPTDVAPSGRLSRGFLRTLCGVCSQEQCCSGGVRLGSSMSEQQQQQSASGVGRSKHGGKNDLEAGSSTHRGERKLVCQQCDKTFTSRKGLTLHTLAHSGVRNYECLECGKKFITKGHLTTHTLTHSGVRNYECLECGKKFITKGHLT
ncbi:zinc finger protein 697-like, partial [Portunus trituberculatus]|uniref:zinc finger protein 697-like n=1 Tax=Portunus trituberculatus TaxID=210409 RepID=UPI001E1CC642